MCAFFKEGGGVRQRACAYSGALAPRFSGGANCACSCAYRVSYVSGTGSSWQGSPRRVPSKEGSSRAAAFLAHKHAFEVLLNGVKVLATHDDLTRTKLHESLGFLI